MAQHHSGRQSDSRVPINRPHDPLDVGRLDDRHFPQRQARKLAELQARGQCRIQGRQVRLQRWTGAPKRGTGWCRGARRLVAFCGPGPRRQPGEWTVIQRPQRRVAGAEQGARVDAGRNRAPRRPRDPLRAVGRGSVDVVGVRPSRAESIDVSGARGGFAMSAPSAGSLSSWYAALISAIVRLARRSTSGSPLATSGWCWRARRRQAALMASEVASRGRPRTTKGFRGIPSVYRSGPWTPDRLPSRRSPKSIGRAAAN